ncbi:MAG: general glycosylation pathway protein, partial [Candidatus Aminicenantes bacterium]|nr:general glycosylation pathway protein [Candidatus Aminicenantes bacterium]
KRVLKDKGILILVSSCREGIGPSAFIELLSGCPNPKDVKGLIEDNYRLGYHKAAKFAETAEKAEMWGVTGLPDTILEKIFMRAISCLQKAVDQAIDIKGKQAHMVILMDGDKIVPVLEN